MSAQDRVAAWGRVYVCCICELVHPLHRSDCPNHPDAKLIALGKRVAALEAR